MPTIDNITKMYLGDTLISSGGDWEPYVRLALCTTKGGSLTFNSYDTEILIVRATSASGAGTSVAKPTVSISASSGTCTQIFSSDKATGMTNSGWWEVWSYYYGTMYTFIYKVPQNVNITIQIPSFFFGAYGMQIQSV